MRTALNILLLCIIWVSSSAQSNPRLINKRGATSASIAAFQKTDNVDVRNQRAGGEYVLQEIGPNSRVWRTKMSSTAQPAGAQGRIVEIATGMNHFDGQRWVPSVPVFEEAGEEFVALRVQHKVRLNRRLNQPGAVTLTTPDGLVLKSTPIGIGLYDAKSGRSALLASIADCEGFLLNSNQVLYADAFRENGIPRMSFIPLKRAPSNRMW